MLSSEFSAYILYSLGGVGTYCIVLLTHSDCVYIPHPPGTIFGHKTWPELFPMIELVTHALVAVGLSAFLPPVRLESFKKLTYILIKKL